ncbi:MAG: phospholipid carrier-dependent glycosyltransferase [bacterium]
MEKIKKFFGGNPLRFYRGDERLKPKIRITILFCLCTVGILLLYLPKYHHFTVLPDIFLLLIISLSAYSLGVKIFSVCLFEFSSSQERFVFGIGLGLAILSYLIMGLGFLKLLDTRIIYGLLLVLIILCVQTSKKSNISSLFTVQSSLFTLQASLIMITCSLCFLHSLCPPFDWDDLAYHLEGPKLYLQHKGIFHISNVAFANFPANIGMLYLLGMLLSSDILAKLFHFSFGLLTLIGISSLCQRHFNPKGSLLATSIFYICPLVIFLSRTAYIDFGLTFYELLSVYAFLNWMTTYHQNRWLIILAIMCGFVAGIKYPGLYTVIILGLSVIGFGLAKIGWRKTISKTAIFGIICAVVGSPWYIKNFVYTHNPFYPFLQNLFIEKVKLSPVEIITAQTSNKVFTLGETWFESLCLPWDVTIYGALGNLPFGATITPVYLALLPLLIFIKKTKIAGIYLLFYIILKFILWSLGLHSSRYLLPIFPFLAIILASIFYTIFDTPKLVIIKRVILSIITGIWLAILSWDGFQIIHFRNPISFILGFESRDDFIRRNAEKGYYNAMEFINQNLPKNAKIYFIGEKKGYYCNREFIPDFSLVHWQWKYSDYKDLAKIKEYFNNQQITHILVNTTVISAYYYPDNGVSKEDVESFNDFASKYLKPLFKEGNLYLYGWKD